MYSLPLYLSVLIVICLVLYCLLIARLCYANLSTIGSRRQNTARRGTRNSRNNNDSMVAAAINLMCDDTYHHILPTAAAPLINRFSGEPIFVVFPENSGRRNPELPSYDEVVNTNATDEQPPDYNEAMKHFNKSSRIF